MSTADRYTIFTHKERYGGLALAWHANRLISQAAEDQAFLTVKQVAAASVLLYLCKSYAVLGVST